MPHNYPGWVHPLLDELHEGQEGILGQARNDVKGPGMTYWKYMKKFVYLRQLPLEAIEMIMLDSDKFREEISADLALDRPHIKRQVGV